MASRRGARGRAFLPFDHGQPIATIGLAPLAGILLTVMLVFAALRPPVQHAVLVDLPAPPYPGEIEVLSPPTNKLIITRDGQVLWNAAPVSDAQLADILLSVADDNPQPSLQFEPAGDAPYGRAVAVMEQIRRAGLLDRCFRFSGVARYRYYEKAPDPDELLSGEWRGCAPYYGY